MLDTQHGIYPDQRCMASTTGSANQRNETTPRRISSPGPRWNPIPTFPEEMINEQTRARRRGAPWEISVVDTPRILFGHFSNGSAPGVGLTLIRALSECTACIRRPTAGAEHLECAPIA